MHRAQPREDLFARRTGVRAIGVLPVDLLSVAMISATIWPLALQDAQQLEIEPGRCLMPQRGEVVLQQCARQQPSEMAEWFDRPQCTGGVAADRAQPAYVAHKDWEP